MPAEYGESVGAEDTDAAYDALAEIGWHVVSSAGKGGVRYAKEGVPDSIVVTEGPVGKILKAKIEYKDGGYDDIYPPAIDNIVAKAKYTEGLYSSEHEEGPTDEVEALDRELTKLGWYVTASSGLGAVQYEKEGVPDTLVITSEEAMGIINAAVEYEDGSSYEISPPDIDAIVAKAKDLSASAH